MDTLKELLALLGFGPENIQATLYISLASVFVPQLLKKRVSVVPELLAAIAGAVAGAALWVEPLKGALVGIILGAFWTFAYKPLMRLAYKRWPDLEHKVSANPQLKRMADGTIGIKVSDEDKTRALTKEERALFIGSPTEAPDTTVPGIKPEPSNE